MDGAKLKKSTHKIDENKTGSQWEWIFASALNPAEHDQDATPSTIEQSRKRKLTSQSTPRQHRSIIGARRGTFECRVGDTLILRGGRSQSWVAILRDFVPSKDDEGVSNDGVKAANFLWFASPREVRNDAKRLKDIVLNEIYITADLDENPLDTILQHAHVSSYNSPKLQTSADRRRRALREPRSFVCRRGCNTRTATFTDDFEWEQIYHGANDIDALIQRVTAETQASRKRRNQADFSGESSFTSKVGVTTTPSKRSAQNEAFNANSPTGGNLMMRSSLLISYRVPGKRKLQFTPLGTRTISADHFSSSPFQVARSNLHVASVPTKLTCREDQFSSVYSYLETAIIEGTGTCIYVSGTPGTGKTATVREVISQLHAAVIGEELDDFIYVEINGMKITEPHQSYSLLWEALTGDRQSPAHALNLLEDEFSSPSPRRVPCVVLMDELDQLVTKSQTVMYNFFNWPNLPHSRLIVIAVANTMDLPERTLSNKISSRLGLTRINFPVYSYEQLVKIIQARLESVPGALLDRDAIQFASRKVAQVSGDARRALDICRRAVEIAEAETYGGRQDTESSSGNNTARWDESVNLGRVSISTVQRAIREATSSPLQQYLRSLPLSSKILVAALTARARRTGNRESQLGDVVDEAKNLASSCQLLPVQDFMLTDKRPGIEELSQEAVVRPSRQPRLLALGSAAMDLMDAGIIMVETKGADRTGRVRLVVSGEEIKLAFKDDAEVLGLGLAV